MFCDEKHVGKNNEMINKINSLVHVQVQFAFFLINHQNLVTVITYPFMDSQVIQTRIMACHINVEGEFLSVYCQRQVPTSQEMSSHIKRQLIHTHPCFQNAL